MITMSIEEAEAILSGRRAHTQPDERQVAAAIVVAELAHLRRENTSLHLRLAQQAQTIRDQNLWIERTTGTAAERDECGATEDGLMGQHLGPCVLFPSHRSWHRDARGTEWITNTDEGA